MLQWRIKKYKKNDTFVVAVSGGSDSLALVSIIKNLIQENKNQSAQLGTIFVDSIFTPIKNVKYHVEDFRVEQKTDYEKLVFDIVTDGSINPQDALTDAARILIHHFILFIT